MHRLSYVPVLFICIISLVLDWYVFQGVRSLTTSLNEEGRSLVYIMFWLSSFVVLNAFSVNFYKAIPTGKFTPLFTVIFNVFITLFITKLTFVFVLFAEDVYRAFAGLINHYPPRSKTLSQIGLLVALVPFLSFIFGVTRGKYHYKVRRTTLFFDDLPEKFDGFTLTQISDIHSGSLDSLKGVQRGIDLINAQRSDVFVFTGDLVNNKASEIEPWISVFKQIKAKSGKFSILGNHDYGDYITWNSQEEKVLNLQRLMENHKKLGFRLLMDEHVKIEREGHSITLLGVENWGLGFGQRGNLNKALQGTEDGSVKILLSHDPSHWDAQVKNYPEKVHLTLSGHTHGMQFGIELFGFKWSPVKYRYPNWAGLATYNNRYLYVNRGFGFLGFAGRVGIWPEITVIQFRKNKSYIKKIK
ncbi:metallophosphoesterase [Pedobacter sp. P351]|uniref:metallophosphoesterase n=1 Tax=Pedobacter superstes TaxID=3133441 RepID=UPI0030A26314